MENLCYFVCSRGLLKSCKIRSKNPISSCNYDFNYLNKMINLSKMEDGIYMFAVIY
jgi:hypothetical protein